MIKELFERKVSRIYLERKVRKSSPVGLRCNHRMCSGLKQSLRRASKNLSSRHKRVSFEIHRAMSIRCDIVHVEISFFKFRQRFSIPKNRAIIVYFIIFDILHMKGFELFSLQFVAVLFKIFSAVGKIFIFRKKQNTIVPHSHVYNIVLH